MPNYISVSHAVFQKDALPIQQAPQPEPTTGTRQKPGMKFVYVIHDNLDAGLNYESRVLQDKIKLGITTEMRVPRRWYYREDIQDWLIGHCALHIRFMGN